MRQKDAPERRLIQLLSGTSARRQATAGEVHDLCAKVDLSIVIGLLKRLNMFVLIGGRLLDLGIADMTQLERELESHSDRARSWGLVTELIALDVLDALETAGIRSMPLKGSTLARRLYRDVAARTSIDVDILVAPDDLAAAVEAVEGLGWHKAPSDARAGRLPLLHETLVHPTLPRIELHWRVHWYERQFAAEALARAAKPTADATLEMQPLDGLIALMLFYARDGFTGLRLAADTAAWWDVKCVGSAGVGASDVVSDQYPALAAPISVASNLLASLVGVPTERPQEVPFRWRVAAGLATPFLEGGRRQAEANAGLTDLLLAPSSAAGDAIRRVMRNAPADEPWLAANAPRRWRVSLGHVLRVARRWALAVVPAAVRGYALGRPRTR